MVPVIALIGRPNVGKSTIFNRLTKTRDAIVADLSGLTRDRKYSLIKIRGHEFICIDTGGIDCTKDEIKMRILKQSLLAIKEADIVLFVVDAREGRMPADTEIAKYLVSSKKLTLLVINKIDGIDINKVISDFRLLGLRNVYFIAALHGRGISNLLDGVLLPFIEKINLPLSLDTADEDTKYWKQYKTSLVDGELKDSFHLHNLPIKIAIVGRPNVGKSTLINHILGEERVVVYDMPGTTRDSIYIPMQWAGHRYVLIDTAGVRKHSKIIEIVEKFSVIKTFQSIKEANVVILVIDACEGVSNQDLSLLSFIHNSGRSSVVAVNKWDSLAWKAKEHLKDAIYYRLGSANFSRIHFISALHGKGVTDLFKSVNEAYNSATRRISATILTRIMSVAVENYRPPLVNYRRVKLKYACACNYNPLIIIIHGNRVKNIPNSYKRYLINCFRKSLDLVGAPIHLKFK